MTIRTILLCWLCGRATDLQVDLFPGATLGSPRLWCRRCTSPRTFARRLRERIAEIESHGTPLPGELSTLLATELATEAHREMALAA